MTRGRRRSVVWACFEEHPAAEGKRRVLCRFCHHDTVANPERMVRHIVRHCPSVDAQHKQICRDYQEMTVPARRRQRSDIAARSNVNSSYSSSASATSAIGALETTQQTQHLPLARLDPIEAQLARDELVLAILTAEETTQPPWGMLDNEHLRRALGRLQPQFEPPSVMGAKRDILPRLYGQAQREMDVFLQSAMALTVVCSSQVVAGNRRRITWTAVDEDGRSELLAVVPQAPAEYPEEIAARVASFVRRFCLPRRSGCLVHLCNESVGASYLARGILKRKQQTSERLGLPAANGSGGKLALTGGCMAQQTLFLLQDVLDTLPSISEALDKCMDVAAFITSSSELHNELERLSTVPKSLRFEQLSPRADDFHSFIVCVHHVLMIKDFLRTTIEENEEIGGELELKQRLQPDRSSATIATIRAARAFADIVGDDNFWQDLDLAAQILQPFAYASWLTECGHGTSSAQLLLCWLLLLAVVRLSSRVPDTEKENFHMRVVDRIRVFSEDHVIACLVLDPRVHGLGLSAPGKRRTRLIVGDLGERLIGLLHHASEGPPRLPFLDRSRLVEQLLQYLNRQRPFDDDEAWETMTSTTVAPRLFWMEYAKEAPELTQVALGVLGFRAFVAPLEDLWRLSTERFRVQQSNVTGDFQVDGDVGIQNTTSSSGKLVPPVDLIRFHHQQLRSRRQRDEEERKRISKYYSTAMPGGPALPYAVFALPVEPATSDLGTEVAQEESRCSGDAAVAFRQLKSWLQRLEDHEKSLPVEDADASLQRFDADWLDLGPDTPRQIRACLDGFLVGNYVHRRGDGDNGTALHEVNLVGGAESASVAGIPHTASLSL